MAIHGIISPTDLDFDITEEDEDYEKQIEHLKYVRGNIIEMLLVIENNIDIIITWLLVKDDKKIKKVFRSKFLNSISISFRRKLDLFYELVKVNNCNIDLKKLEKSSNFLTTERNRWAHGKIFFERKLIKNRLFLQPILLYNDGKGENKSQEFDDKYIINLNNKIELVYDDIHKIIDDLGITDEYITKDFE